MHRPLLKTISISLIAVLLLQEVSWAAPDTQAVVRPDAVLLTSPQSAGDRLRDPMALDVPFEHVTVKEAYRGNSGKLVIHIQDAHANLSGQENLAAAIDHMMDRHPGLSTVFVEGASRDVTLDGMKGLAPAKLWKRAAQRFLRDGLIAGQEYVNLTSERPMRLVGVEDEELSRKSLEAYAQLKAQREKTLSYLERIRSTLVILKNRFYPASILAYESSKSGARLSTDTAGPRDLLRLRQIAGTPLAAYPEVVKLAALLDRERDIDFDRASVEQAALCQRLASAGLDEELSSAAKADASNSRTGQAMFLKKLLGLAASKKISTGEYPELLKYRDYLEAFQVIRLDRVVEEMESLETEIYEKLLTDDAARKVYAIQRFSDLLSKAYRTQLTSREFETLVKNRAAFPTAGWEAFMNEKLLWLDQPERVIPYETVLEDSFSFIRRFYGLVERRDFTFVERSERVMEEGGLEAAFLVAGGYHTEHLTELLRARGISYLVLTPHVTHETDQAKYERLLFMGYEGSKKPQGASSAEFRDNTTRSQDAWLTPSGYARWKGLFPSAASVPGFSETQYTGVDRFVYDRAFEEAEPDGAKLAQAKTTYKHIAGNANIDISRMYKNLRIGVDDDGADIKSGSALHHFTATVGGQKYYAKIIPNTQLGLREGRIMDVISVRRTVGRVVPDFSFRQLNEADIKAIPWRALDTNEADAEAVRRQWLADPPYVLLTRDVATPDVGERKGFRTMEKYLTELREEVRETGDASRVLEADFAVKMLFLALRKSGVAHRDLGTESLKELFINPSILDRLFEEFPLETIDPDDPKFQKAIVEAFRLLDFGLATIEREREFGLDRLSRLDFGRGKADRAGKGEYGRVFVQKELTMHGAAEFTYFHRLGFHTFYRDEFACMNISRRLAACLSDEDHVRERHHLESYYNAHHNKLGEYAAKAVAKTDEPEDRRQINVYLQKTQTGETLRANVDRLQKFVQNRSPVRSFFQMLAAIFFFYITVPVLLYRFMTIGTFSGEFIPLRRIPLAGPPPSQQDREDADPNAPMDLQMSADDPESGPIVIKKGGNINVREVEGGALQVTITFASEALVDGEPTPRQGGVGVRHDKAEEVRRTITFRVPRAAVLKDGAVIELRRGGQDDDPRFTGRPAVYARIKLNLSGDQPTMSLDFTQTPSKSSLELAAGWGDKRNSRKATMKLDADWAQGVLARARAADAIERTAGDDGSTATGEGADAAKLAAASDLAADAFARALLQESAFDWLGPLAYSERGPESPYFVTVRRSYEALRREGIYSTDEQVQDRLRALFLQHRGNFGLVQRWAGVAPAETAPEGAKLAFSIAQNEADFRLLLLTAILDRGLTVDRPFIEAAANSVYLGDAFYLNDPVVAQFAGVRVDSLTRNKVETVLNAYIERAWDLEQKLDAAIAALRDAGGLRVAELENRREGILARWRFEQERDLDDMFSSYRASEEELNAGSLPPAPALDSYSEFRKTEYGNSSNAFRAPTRDSSAVHYVKFTLSAEQAGRRNWSAGVAEAQILREAFILKRISETRPRAARRIPNFLGVGRAPTATIEGYDVSDKYYLVTEAVPGESLETLIQRAQNLSDADALAAIRLLFEAIGDLHADGVAHGDLAHQEVIVDIRRGEARIVDYGVAVVEGDHSEFSLNRLEMMGRAGDFNVLSGVSTNRFTRDLVSVVNIVKLLAEALPEQSRLRTVLLNDFLDKRQTSPFNLEHQSFPDIAALSSFFERALPRDLQKGDGAKLAGGAELAVESAAPSAATDPTVLVAPGTFRPLAERVDVSIASAVEEARFRFPAADITFTVTAPYSEPVLVTVEKGSAVISGRDGQAVPIVPPTRTAAVDAPAGAGVDARAVGEFTEFMESLVRSAERAAPVLAPDGQLKPFTPVSLIRGFNRGSLYLNYFTLTQTSLFEKYALEQIFVSLDPSDTENLDRIIAVVSAEKERDEGFIEYLRGVRAGLRDASVFAELRGRDDEASRLVFIGSDSDFADAQKDANFSELVKNGRLSISPVAPPADEKGAADMVRAAISALIFAQASQWREAGGLQVYYERAAAYLEFVYQRGMNAAAFGDLVTSKSGLSYKGWELPPIGSFLKNLFSRASDALRRAIEASA